MRIKKEINVEIGEQIKKAREKAKLTQEQFAEKIEVSPQYISDLERGVVGISIPTLKRACVELGVSSDQILFGRRSDDCCMFLEERCKKLNATHFEILSVIINKFLEAVQMPATDVDAE